MSRFDLHSEPPTGTMFHERYKHFLLKENLAPYRPVMPSLLKDRLEINVDVIDRNDLLILLHTLVNDDSLKSVAIESHLLRDNPQLTHDIMKLHYHSNIRLPVYTDPEIMSSICNALYRHLVKNEWNLTVFRLIGIPMTEKHLATITAAFPASKSMKILSLEAMPLYQKHMNVLATSLPLLSSLIILNLSNCGLTSKLISTLCTFVSDDPKLERLILNSNPIGDNGVAEIAKALASNSKFRALDVQNCGITSVGCQALIQMLFSNHSIEVCDIRRNTAIPRECALDIAKIMLDNNKNQSKQTCYRPLQPTTSAPIFVDEVPICVQPEKPRGTLPPRDVSPVKLHPRARENISLVPPPTGSETLKDEGVFVSNEFLSRLENSLIKFQVLLDYLERERTQADNSRLKSSKISERSERASRADDGDDLSLRGGSQFESVRNGVETRSRMKSNSASDAPDVAHTESHPAADESETVHSASQSASSRSGAGMGDLPSEKYSETFVSSKSVDSTTVTETSKRQESPSASSPSRPSTGQSTIKQTSTSRKSMTTLETRDETGKDADVTITSDNAMDSFGLNLASIEGISKRSSYLKIANEIYEDPHILESTRASAALYDDSQMFQSRRSSSSSRRTDTNIDELEERLKVIKTKYNEIEGPLRKLGAAFKATKDSVDVADDASSSDSKPRVRNLKLDDVSISESWIADAIGESNDRSVNSIPSSFSGDLTGSDLEDF